MVKIQDGKIVSDDDNPDIPVAKDGWYYTAKEYAVLMDVPEVNVRMWKRRGILPCIDWYGRILIPADAEVLYKKQRKNRL